MQQLLGHRLVAMMTDCWMGSPSLDFDPPGKQQRMKVIDASSGPESGASGNDAHNAA